MLPTNALLLEGKPSHALFLPHTAKFGWETDNG